MNSPSQTNRNPDPTLPLEELVAADSAQRASADGVSESSVRYHCVCGQEFAVDADGQSKCPNCARIVHGQILRSNLSLTVSLSQIENPPSSVSLGNVAGPDPIIGRNLGHFRIDQVIGHGGMGTVYRALDTSLQRFVAVKVIHRRSVSDQPSGRLNSDRRSDSFEDMSGMLEEAIAQARLNHPNVATIYYVGRDGEEPFMAMELLAGGTLADRIRYGPLSYHVAVGYLLRVACALQHAHEFDIVHADIKPSNLLLTDTEDVKLSDFGLARSTKLKRGEGRVSGTPNYLAPELIEGEPASIQSDMYALGVTLFEFLFGRYPYRLSGETLLQKLSTHAVAAIEYPVPWPTSVPIEVRPFLDRLLAKSPKDRFPDYESLIDQLELIQPVNSVSAGLVPRALAFLIDQTIVLVTTFIVAAIAGQTSLVFGLPDWVKYIAYLGCLGIIGAHLWWVKTGRKTTGRLVFQLKTVDEHGLPLSPTSRLLREALRTAIPISLYIAAFNGIPALVMAGTTSIIFSFGNLISLALTSGQRTLHDLITHSHVTLETIRQHRSRRRRVLPLDDPDKT